jgi:threonine aldolase
MKHIDLRSDTVTHPPQDMKKAMVEAELGDDVFGDDPTVNELERMAAELLGKDAAVFVPTGVMGNQLALFTHCRQGQEVILPDESHVVQHEAGAAAVFAKVQLRTLEAKKGLMDLELLSSKIRRDIEDPHHPSTGLILVQQPTAYGNVLPLDYLKKVREICDQEKIPLHMDGARLFNAAAYLGVPVKEVASYADSVMFCLSKGLCCPVGSLVVGSKDFIAKVRRNRKLFGGTMRQVGILAAAGIWALKNIAPRMGDDLKASKLLAKELSSLGNFMEILQEPEINMVFFKINNEKVNCDELGKLYFENGIKVCTPGKDDNGTWRFVTHYWIGEKEIQKIIEVIRNYFKSVGAI